MRRRRFLLLSVITLGLASGRIMGQTSHILLNEAIRLVEAREFRTAIDVLKEVLATDSLQGVAYHQLALSYLATDQPEAALHAAIVGLYHFPGDPGLELAKADALVVLGRLGEAVPLYRSLHRRIGPRDRTDIKGVLGRRLASLLHAEALTAYNANDDDKAEGLLGEALTYDSSNVQLYRLAASIAVRRNQWSDVERISQEGIAQCGPDTILLRIQARARYELNDRAGLLQTANRLQSLLPDDPNGELVYADALILNDRVMEGIAVLEGILRKHPERREAYAALAHIHRRRFDAKAAARVLEREARMFAADPDAHLRLGEALELAEEWDDARTAYRKFGTLSGDSIASCLLVARTFEREDSTAGAIREYRKILTWNRTQPEALMKLARIFLRMKRWDEALTSLEALEKSRKDAEVMSLIGWCLEQQGRRGEARRFYERAVAAGTENPLAYYRLSLIVKDSSDTVSFGLAETALRKALARLEQIETGLGAAARDQMASLGDRREEREQYEESGALADAVFWFLAGSFPGNNVEELFERLLQIHDESGKLHYLVGLFLRSTGAYEKAMAHFLSATRRTPGYAPAQAELGKELERNGRLEDALVSFERALALAPLERKYYEEVLRISEKAGVLDDLATRWLARFRATPDNAILKGVLIEALHKTGRFQEATAIIDHTP